MNLKLICCVVVLICVFLLVPVVSASEVAFESGSVVSGVTAEFDAYTRVVSVLKGNVRESGVFLDFFDGVNNNVKVRRFFRVNSQGVQLAKDLDVAVGGFEGVTKAYRGGFDAIGRLSRSSGKNLLSGVSYHTEYEALGRGAQVLEKAAKLKGKGSIEILKTVGGLTEGGDKRVKSKRR